MRPAAGLLLSAGLFFLCGCPEASNSAPPQSSAAAKTAAVEGRQAQERLDAIARSTTAEEEAAAIEALVTWLRAPRPWRTEPYRVRVLPGEGPALDPAALIALSQGSETPELILECPAFPDAPRARVAVKQASNLAVLRDVLLP